MVPYVGGSGGSKGEHYPEWGWEEASRAEALHHLVVGGKHREGACNLEVLDPVQVLINF
jgi:hypothetical protein